MFVDFEIVRGTNMDIEYIIYYEDGSIYNLQDGDKIIFGVKENDVNSDNSKYIIKKIATSKDKINEGYGIYFVPSDTLNLEHKNYFYDVGIQTSDGKYYMTTECSIFKVRRAITSKE